MDPGEAAGPHCREGEKTMYTEFKKFLYSIGFNDNGVREIITRLEQDRADRYDKDLYKRYLRERKTEG